MGQHYAYDSDGRVRLGYFYSGGVRCDDHVRPEDVEFGSPVWDKDSTRASGGDLHPCGWCGFTLRAIFDAHESRSGYVVVECGECSARAYMPDDRTSGIWVWNGCESDPRGLHCADIDHAYRAGGPW